MPDELVKTVFHVAEAPAAAIESPPVAVAPTTAIEAASAASAPPSQCQLFIVIPSCVSTKGRTVRHLPSVRGRGGRATCEKSGTIRKGHFRPRRGAATTTRNPSLFL